MSVLLEAVRDHLTAAPSVLTGYVIRFFRWTDADLNGTQKVVLFRRGGTGEGDYTLDVSDVLIRLIVPPEQAKAGEAKAREIEQRFYAAPEGGSIVHVQPLGAIIGPVYLQNDRAMFDLNVRVSMAQQ
jgi:hypothetical protein